MTLLENECRDLIPQINSRLAVLEAAMGANEKVHDRIIAQMGNVDAKIDSIRAQLSKSDNIPAVERKLSELEKTVYERIQCERENIRRLDMIEKIIYTALGSVLLIILTWVVNSGIQQQRVNIGNGDDRAYGEYHGQPAAK